MVAARLIVVGQDDDMAAAQMLAVVSKPLAGAAGIARRDQPTRAQRINVLFALRDEHGLGGIGGDQLGKTVGDALDPASIPYPTAAAIAVCCCGSLRAEDKKSADKDEGWISIFDGKTLKGWKASEKPEGWTVEDGCIVGQGDRSHLFYVEKEFAVSITEAEARETLTMGALIHLVDLKVKTKKNA